MDYQHIPVMLDEAIEYLDPQPGQNYIDCTLGGGGYTFELAKKVLPEGMILSIDLDEMAIVNAERIITKNGIKNVVLAKDNFKNLTQILDKNWRNKMFSGIVMDLGLSSAQLNDRDRGFSFKDDAPLNMAFGTQIEISAEKIINEYKQADIEKILREYGEEKYAHSIAALIVRERDKNKIQTTGRLVEIISRATPPGYRYDKKINFATKTFQALRIAVNDELGNLETALPLADNILEPGGRIVVISYHSLEDRIVKNYFKYESCDCVCPPAVPVCQCGHQAKLKIITKKPLVPTEAEIARNPRARSAKMRVAEKI
jgi:16S rRNA (cytosine1402-N4)-methyltransferase